MASHRRNNTAGHFRADPSHTRSRRACWATSCSPNAHSGRSLQARWLRSRPNSRCRAWPIMGALCRPYYGIGNWPHSHSRHNSTGNSYHPGILARRGATDADSRIRRTRIGGSCAQTRATHQSGQADIRRSYGRRLLGPIPGSRHYAANIYPAQSATRIQHSSSVVREHPACTSTTRPIWPDNTWRKAGCG